MASGWIFCPSGNPRENATPALVVAMAGKPSSSIIRALTTSQALTSTRVALPECSARNVSAFCLCSTILSATGIAASTALVFHPRLKFADTDHGAAHRSSSNFLLVVTNCDPQSVEATIKEFQNRISSNLRANAAGRPVLDVDRSSDRDFIALTVGLQGVKCRSLPEADHIRGRIDRRQFRMMRGQRVLELDCLGGRTASTDGSIFHECLQKIMSQ